jgi:hypothetical protein
MPVYSIRVSQTKYPDYPCYSFYDIETANRDDASKEARKRFCSTIGFEFKDTTAYVLYNQQRQSEDLQRLIECGLPDEIPS